MDQFRELMFEEFHPSRTARGEQRQRNILVATQIFGQAVDELGAFLHDGQVGGPIGIKHIVETEGLEGGGQLARSNCAGFHAELFTDSHTHGGSHLDNRFLGGIHDGADNIAGVVNLSEGAHRTNCHALTAEGTR